MQPPSSQILSPKEDRLWNADGRWAALHRGRLARFGRRTCPRATAWLRPPGRERVAIDLMRIEDACGERAFATAEYRVRRARRRSPGSVDLALVHAELAMRSLAWELAVERWSRIRAIYGRRAPVEVDARLATALMFCGRTDEADSVLRAGLAELEDEGLDIRPGGEGRAPARRTLRFAAAALAQERGLMSDAEERWRQLLCDPALDASARRLVQATLTSVLRRSGRPIDEELAPARLLIEDHEGRYERWLAAVDGAASRSPQEASAEAPERMTWTVLVPIHGGAVVAMNSLRRTIGSLQLQTDVDWELLLAPLESGKSIDREDLFEPQGDGQHIRVLTVDDGPVGSGHVTSVARLWEQAHRVARGTFVLMLLPGDVLVPRALERLGLEAQRWDADVVYCDEDIIMGDGSRRAPLLKPGFDTDLLLSQPFLGRSVAFRLSSLAAIISGPSVEDIPGSLTLDAQRLLVVWSSVLARLREDPMGRGSGVPVRHVPEVLLHVAPPPREDGSAERLEPHVVLRDAVARAHAEAMVVEHLRRLGVVASVSPRPVDGPLHIVWGGWTEEVAISLIIPTKDRVELLRACIDGIDATRDDRMSVEIVLVDNGTSEPDAVVLLAELRGRSDVVIVDAPGAFNFSRLVNAGVRASNGEVCILMNNDVVPTGAGWLEELAGHALRDGVGAVGALLTYADGAVQHAGVIVGFNGIAEHAFREWAAASDGYLGLLSSTRRVSAVTAACMAFRRDVHSALDGLDEEDLPVELNDIDFCLRARRDGLGIVWTPHARLVHLEGASRGDDVSADRLRSVERQRAAFVARWGTELASDPYYHPGLSRAGTTYLLSDC